MKTIIRTGARSALLLVTGLSAVGILAAGPAEAQQRGAMFGSPYDFPATNRANNAIVMKQVESGMFSSSVGSSAGGAATGSSTVLICGGGASGSETNASSDATGNSSCIILNNATGGISIGQDSAGDQNAETEATGADAVSEVLNGETPQGTN